MSHLFPKFGAAWNQCCINWSWLVIPSSCQFKFLICSLSLLTLESARLWTLPSLNPDVQQQVLGLLWWHVSANLWTFLTAASTTNVIITVCSNYVFETYRWVFLSCEWNSSALGSLGLSGLSSANAPIVFFCNRHLQVISLLILTKGKLKKFSHVLTVWGLTYGKNIYISSIFSLSLQKTLW